MTAAIGDGWLKLPTIYTKNVFIHLDTPWMHRESLPKYLPRLQTPPYVSSTPDVYHRRLRRRKGSGNDPCDAFLITCSDGLLDLGRPEPISLSQPLIDRWVEVVGRSLGGNHAASEASNLALALLRDCIGGDDIHLVSRNLTVEMEERWMDDITILVQRFI